MKMNILKLTFLFLFSFNVFAQIEATDALKDQTKEIPKGTKFEGLSKPKMRYIDENGKYIGRDKNMRALYRDVFVDLDTEDLDGLIIHELAHIACNHVNYYDDNHGKDFKWAESILTYYWN